VRRRWAGRCVDPAGASLSRSEASDPAALVARARDGDPRAVARLISLVEDQSPLLGDVARELAPFTGRAHVVGLTGAPGVGKSTTTSALVSALRSAGRRVGVLAVDPSSPFTGGALLGDRIRMQEHSGDDGVFIRSMATRGHLGGLAASAPQAVRVLDAAGCDVVVVETVGVGQSEVEVAGLADTTVVLLAPGMGDAIQAAKAGILEVGNVYCVNKADRDGADATARELRTMVSIGRNLEGSDASEWRPPIVQTVASRGEGVGELLEAINAHREYLEAHGQLHVLRRDRARAEIEALAVAGFRSRLTSGGSASRLKGLAAQVAAGEVDPYTAAAALSGEPPGE
jgi:LAO/AO transport system kinase